jgi:hypothetical protein
MMLLQIQKSIPEKSIPEYLRPEMIGGLTLKPSITCPVQTVATIAEKVHVYPKQEIRNFGALTFADKTEPDDDRQISNTLVELYAMEHVNHFFVYTKGKGMVVIERLVNGDFVAIDSFEEKRDSEAIRATMPATVSDK